MRAITIGLGSNVGDRRAYLRAAAALLADTLDVTARSAIYETPPLGPPQPHYLNAAVRAETELGFEPILDVLLATERRLGRERGERWGPRTIDLDLLHADGESFQSDRLVVPHPGLRDRTFALAPLVDVTFSPELSARLAELGGPPPVVGRLDEPLDPASEVAVRALLVRATAT